MADMADFVNEEQVNSLEKLLDYQSGSMTDVEAHEQGLLDEFGCLPSDAPNVWGVHDVESLQSELDKAELAFLRAQPKKPTTRQVWVSGGKVYLPKDMHTKHLVNAVAYAERNGMDEPIVEEMRREIHRRTNPSQEKS